MVRRLFELLPPGKLAVYVGVFLALIIVDGLLAGWSIWTILDYVVIFFAVLFGYIVGVVERR